LNLLHQSAATPDRVLLLVDPLVRTDGSWEIRFAEALRNLFGRLDYSCELRTREIDGLRRLMLSAAGPGVWPLALAEAGVHIYCRRHENLQPIQVSVLPATVGDTDRRIDEWYAARRRWMHDLAAGRASPDDDPCRLGDIVRFYDEAGAVLDLRTGRSLPRFPTADEWKSLVLGGLPLPAEWEAP